MLAKAVHEMHAMSVLMLAKAVHEFHTNYKNLLKRIPKTCIGKNVKVCITKHRKYPSGIALIRRGSPEMGFRLPTCVPIFASAGVFNCSPTESGPAGNLFPYRIFWSRKTVLVELHGTHCRPPYPKQLYAAYLVFVFTH